MLKKLYKSRGCKLLAELKFSIKSLQIYNPTYLIPLRRRVSGVIFAGRPAMIFIFGHTRPALICTETGYRISVSVQISCYFRFGYVRPAMICTETGFRISVSVQISGYFRFNYTRPALVCTERGFRISVSVQISCYFRFSYTRPALICTETGFRLYVSVHSLYFQGLCYICDLL